MGFWPFGGGKKQRAAGTNKHAREQSFQSDPSSHVGVVEKANTEMSGDTKGSTRKEQTDKSRRLSSKSRVVSQEEPKRSETAPVSMPSSRRVSRGPPQPLSEKALYQHNPTSQSSLGPENFNVVRQPPTLHARRPEQDPNLARRKSSKRKAEEYAREREIKAMSGTSPIPIPKRPTSFYGSGPLGRETRDIPGVLHKKSHRPNSQVSLPLPGSLPVGDISQQHTFKIGMFAALSPRPTIKYDANPRQDRGKQPQRPILSTRPTIVEEESDPDKKRIDDLADDLDANGLRELMERDRKRKERRRKQDQARLERRLQRRADREREEEAKKARTEEYVSASRSRVRGLGIDSPRLGEVKDETVQAGPSKTRAPAPADPFADPKSQAPSPVAIRNPFEDEKDLDVMNDASSDIDPELAVPVRSPLRKIKTNKVQQAQKPAQAALSPPVSPAPRAADRQSMSQGSLLNRELTTELPETASVTGAASDHSSQRLNSWTAFFKRGTRRKLSSSYHTPSEFSNTSRESFSRKQPPPAITNRTFRRADSATPQRTMSKFKEDLPELPISPPDSRMQSPENAVPPTTTFNQAVTSPKLAVTVPETMAYTPSSPIPTGANRTENTQASDLDVPTSAKPEMMLSQSLASVDSEASWLSGKPINRRSGASQRLKPSRSSLTKPMPGAFDGASDALPSPSPDVVEQDPLTVPGEIVPGDETWHAAVGRQPMLVRQASRAKSKEGLLKEYTSTERKDSSPESGEEEQEPEPEPEVTLMRAQSVDYKKGHARHISAGSARLFDIRRSSVRSEDLLNAQAAASSQEQRKLSQAPTNWFDA